MLAPCKTYHFATLYIQKNIVDEPLKMLDLLREYDEYLRLYPNESSAYHNRSELLKHLGLYELALKDEEQAVRLSPNFAMGWCNKAFIQLTLGDYLEGWKNYEWRWKTDVITFQDNGWPIPRWQGEEIGNAKLLVHAEQGFGDNLQFVRFAIEAKKRGLNIVVVSHKPVEKLINYNLERYQVPFSENGQAISHLSYYVSMMSLPHYLGTTVDTIPYAEGYLQAEPERFAKWQAKITACDKLKVGLVWAGSTKHNRNQSRSLQFKQLSKLLELNAEFYCLQKDITEQDLVDAQAFENLHFFYQDIEDFSDTAALVAQMDFVISVDTSVAHLSGAMAKSTWVMLTYHPDFRWLLDRDDSPWYHSVCLFRQDFDYNWQTVIDRIYQQLKLTVQEHQNV
ncbi:glycosyltransferase [Pasteurellaceae bacterium 15-036681]|nr:glycosyltransferase [Pasteurellaceae bacterium 15-036681]